MWIDINQIAERGSESAGICLINTALSAAALLLLDWRAFHQAIGAEDAAVAKLWLEDSATALAPVEELTCSGRHDFLLAKAAMWTGQVRAEFSFRGGHCGVLVLVVVKGILHR